jgi:hypothetical protein
MSVMKNRGDGAIASNDTTPVKQAETPAAANNGGLNTSFSAMNNNLSMKWQAKKNNM